MTLKEARKATRGMFTRIETVITFNVVYFDPQQKRTIEKTIEAESLKAARNMALADGFLLVDIEQVGKRQCMYAMERDKFRSNADKTILLEE